MFIFCGDPHFQIENIPEIDIFISSFVSLASSLSPTLIIIGGDLLHTHERIHTIPLNKAYEFIHKIRKIAPTYILVGNHDYINNQQFLTNAHWMNGMKEWENVVIVDTIITKKINEDLFIFVPYVPNGRFIEALSKEENWKDATAIFAHQEFYGCKMGAKISDDGDKWDLSYPQIISGHIHGNQTPQANIYYSGSALQHAFGESSHKIIALLKFEQKKLILEEVSLNLPKKHTVYLDVNELEDYKYKENGDKYRITVKGGVEEFKTIKQTQAYKELVKKGAKVVFKPRGNIEENERKMKEEVDFKDILYKLILKENNENLIQIYEEIINDKQILII